MTSAAWPKLRYEEHPWAPAAEPGTASRREIRRHQGPYRAAIPAAIAQQPVPVPDEVAAAADDAAMEIARFDEQMGHVVAPFAHLLLRTESAASSQIEKMTASARAIAEAELTADHRRGNASQIVANSRAMSAAIELSADLSAHAILQMHDALMRPHDPQIAGRWRDQQVWIGGGRLGPHDAVFVPPIASRVPDAIGDLVAFMDRDDIPVLVQAAVAHAQFETIHPFADGNGRTGRALIHSLLHGKGITRNVTVPVSAGLLTDVDAYCSALDAYRDGDPGAIVSRLADAAFASIVNGRTLVGELQEIRASWGDRMKVRRDSHSWRIADLLIAHPVVDARLIAASLGIAQSNVHTPLRPLVDAGIVVQGNDQRRGRIWRSNEVLAALDAFAARSGRRIRRP